MIMGAPVPACLTAVAVSVQEGARPSELSVLFMVRFKGNGERGQGYGWNGTAEPPFSPPIRLSEYNKPTVGNPVYWNCPIIGLLS